jgi:hypothetical protein
VPDPRPLLPPVIVRVEIRDINGDNVEVADMPSIDPPFLRVSFTDCWLLYGAVDSGLKPR